jgi:hypothetical protein
MSISRNAAWNRGRFISGWLIPTTQITPLLRVEEIADRIADSNPQLEKKKSN